MINLYIFLYFNKKYKALSIIKKAKKMKLTLNVGIADLTTGYMSYKNLLSQQQI